MCPERALHRQHARIEQRGSQSVSRRQQLGRKTRGAGRTTRAAVQSVGRRKAEVEQRHVAGRAEGVEQGLLPAQPASQGRARAAASDRRHERRLHSRCTAEAARLGVGAAITCCSYNGATGLTLVRSGMRRRAVVRARAAWPAGRTGWAAPAARPVAAASTCSPPTYRCCLRLHGCSCLPPASQR